MVAPSVLDVDVLALLPSAAWGLSVSACGDIAEDILIGVCDVWEVVTELCLLISLVEVGSLSGAVTTANNAFGIVSTAGLVDDTDDEVSAVGELVTTTGVVDDTDDKVSEVEELVKIAGVVDDTDDEVMNVGELVKRLVSLVC